MKPQVAKLQKRNLGIYKAYQMIGNVEKSKLKCSRDGVEFPHWFNFAVTLVQKVNAVPSAPRLAENCSLSRPNVEIDDPLSYYKRNMAIQFFNDINSQLEYRLNKRNHTEIFAAPYFERNYNLEITVKILLEKCHNEIANEGTQFCSELKRCYNFWKD